VSPLDIHSRITAYNLSPNRYDESEVAELKEYADIYGIPFDNSIEGAKRAQKSSGVISQFSSGFTEGVLGPLAFGGWSEDPVDETQSIAHSMGHLLGFALPLAGSVLTLGGSGIARLGLSASKYATRASSVGKVGGAINTARRGIGYVGEGMQSVGKVARQGSKVNIKGMAEIPIKSVPLAVADYGEKWIKDKLTKHGWEVAKHIGKSTGKGKALDIAFQSAHLGVASGVSGLFNGENDELNNVLFGAVAGGAFGGLGNFVTMGKMIQHPNVKVQGAGIRGLWKYSKEFATANKERLISMGAGSAFQGGMATMQGAPTATQIYEYLLGGFFGFQAQGTAIKEANSYYNKFNSEKNSDGTLKYNFDDIMKMTDRPEFFKLSKEAQDIVKESHFNHLGEFYDNTITVAGATLKETIESSKLSARQRIADEKGKKVEELDKYEVRQADAEQALESSRKSAEMEARDLIVNKVYEGIIDETKKTPEIEKISKSLTPEELADVKNGDIAPLDKAIVDYFESKPHEPAKTTLNDILRAEQRLSEGQPEVSNQGMIGRFINRIQEASRDLPFKAEEIGKDAVELFNKKEIRESNDIRQSIKDYLGALTNKYPGLIIPKKDITALGQLFNRIQQEQHRPILSWNISEQASTRVKYKNILNKIVSSLSPKPADEVINVDKKLWSDNVTVFEFSEVVNKNRNGDYYTVKPYDKKFNFYKGEWVNEVSPSDWLQINSVLWNKRGDRGKDIGHEYLKIPKKDNGVERIYKFHRDTKKTSTKDILSEVSKNSKSKEINLDLLKKFYRYDRDIWYETMGKPRSQWNSADRQFLDKVFDASFRSNYLYEKNYNFKDAVARVKREALFASKAFFQVNPKDFTKLTKGTDEIDIYLVEAERFLLDTVKEKIDGTKEKIKKFLNVKGKAPETFKTVDKNGKIVEQAWESKVDGWIVMHSDLYKQFLKSNFLDESTSHMKPAVAVEIGGQLFLIKGGVHPSRKAYDKVLKNPNSMIVVTSASKHIPKGAEIFKGQARGKTIYDLIDSKGNKASAPSLKMPIKDFRINYGVYGDSHSAQATTIKKQMHSFFDSITMTKPGFENFMNDVLEVPLRGTPENNLYIEQLKTNDKLPLPKNFDISKLRDKDFVDIVNDTTHPLHKELNFEIFKKLKEMEIENEFPEMQGKFQELKEYVDGFSSIYKATNYNPLAEVLNMNLYQRAVHQYRLNRFTQPKWEYSASGWVAGVDPVMEAITGGIKDNASYKFWNGKSLETQKVGHVMLGESHKTRKIKWINDKTTTLEDAWNEYQNALKDLKSNTPIATEESIARMRNRLMLAVMRVPANAVSGTRALLFDGFVKTDYKDITDYGVYMKGRDHFYIDGADVDGDKVFFYQGLPKEYIKDLIKNDSFLENKKGVFFENKAEKLDKVFNSELSKKRLTETYGLSEFDYVKNNPISQWSPGALRKAGQSSYFGKQGMGRVVNTKSFLNTVLSDIITNKNGKLDIPVYRKKPDSLGRPVLLGKLKGTTSEEFLKSPEGYYVMGVEASSRTADSANYFRMATAEQMQEILFKSAFENLNFFPTKEHAKYAKKMKFKTEPKYRHLTNSIEYKAVNELNQKLYGYNWDKGRNWTTAEVQESLKELQVGDTYMSSILTIAKHMSANNIDVNPLKNFNFRSLDNSIRALGRNIWKDNNLLEFSIRENLLIKPQYWNIDYLRVYEQMKNNHPEFVMYKGTKNETTLPKITSEKGKSIYIDFLWKGIENKLPKEVQKTFDLMYTNERANLKNFHRLPISKFHSSIERDFRINDTWDIFSALKNLEIGQKVKNAMAEQGRRVDDGSKVPYQDINTVAFKLINGEKLTDSEQTIKLSWRRKVQEAVDTYAGYKKPVEKVENDWIVFRDYIGKSAQHIKALFRKGYKNKEVAVYETQESANKLIDNKIVDITKKAEEYGINPTYAVDYFNSFLLGSISPQAHHKKNRLHTLKKDLLEAKTESEKDLIQSYIDNIDKNYESTSIPKFAWELSSIPDKSKNDFLKGYADLFDLLNSRTPEELKTIKPEFFFRDKNVVEKDAPESIPEFIENKQLRIDRLSDIGDVSVDKSKIPADIQNKVLPSIKNTLKTLPFELSGRIDDLFVLMKTEEGFKNITSIRGATWSDLRNFDRMLKEFVEQGAVVQKRKSDGKPMAFYKNIYNYLFPDRLGQRMSTHDLAHLYSVKVPIKNLDGSMGESSIKIPLSAMSYLQRSSNSIRRFEDAIKNQLQEDLFKSVSVKGEIEALPNGIEKFQKLLEIAIKDKNIKRDISKTKMDFYQSEYLKSAKDLHKISGEVFRVTRDGKTVQKTGEELIKDIQDQVDKFFKEDMYESWIGSGLFNKDGKWEKIDWSKIDDLHEYKDKGLFIHDIIKYDKFGRFDIENFENKVIKKASEGDISFGHLIGNRNNPLSVELLNRVQYEIALEEMIQFNKLKPNSKEAQNFRNDYRKTYKKDKATGEFIFNETAFVGIGQIKDGYWPQMLHNKEKLMPWIKEESAQLKIQLENYLNSVSSQGKLSGIKDIKKRYRPTDYEIKAYLGLIPNKKMSKTEILEKYLTIQNQDFQILTGRRVEGDGTGEWAQEWLNSRYRDSKKDWQDSNFSTRPGTGGARGQIPMPHFSYSPEVMKKYAEQWTSSFFKNTLALMARKTIRKYENENPMPKEVLEPWANEMRLFIKEQMGQGSIMPMHYVGLSNYQRARMSAYIKDNKDNKEVAGTVFNFKERLKKDDSFKKTKRVKNLRFAISDQSIIDWLDLKSQGLGRLTGKLKGFGTIENPKLPLIGELPTSQRAREREIHQFVTNVGNFEAKMSLLSLLAHPKTALANIFGGSQNTITNAGLRNFYKANDTKWLLTHVFKDAKLKDGTKITDKNTIRRWISEVGALESFYVTEASMDKSLSITRMRPFINEMGKKLFTKEMNDTTWKEIAKKHRVWDSIVASGGYFMRTSEAKLRADAFLAHYLHAKEVYSQLVPNLKFDNPYLVRHALKGVEATQFIYHNVNRPGIGRSALGKMLTRFQPFAWNSVKFRRHIYKTAKRYGMTDKQSVDRLKRFMAQDLMVASLANIFVASLFDSTLPPPMSWLQSSADLLFGDPDERERAFFSSYPHPAMAPLQVVTAPIHRFYLPVITAMINGDWEKYSRYYIHTLFPAGRLAKSLIKTMETPEMFPEYMFGMPVHKLGRKIRASKKEEENV